MQDDEPLRSDEALSVAARSHRAANRVHVRVVDPELVERIGERDDVVAVRARRAV